MTINAKPATRRAARLVALIALGALALTGCTTASTAPADRPSAAAPAATAAADSVAVHDAWIKAVDSGMTGAFGQLENTGTADVTVVSVSTEISHMVELHETVENEAGEMTMREVEDGFNIAAGDTLLLEPGANHIMLMGIEQPLVAGDVVSFTVLFSDDSTLTFEAPVKDYSGANENYEGAEHGDEHGEMDH
ncbi:hypothetical protein GCM10009860_22310 [Microbacterium mitrae]|uniref:Copper chaperone PCu(A)C n=1 Tax=Microbacterium mitrae TaxID=664640 RepID=A0A5C8HLG5_9MICO|nr:copper chaperone PCu(A)C [Microbacterium mitrae]TXK04085.1 copper chaperone PCu(A)C [Microbacterium mitrae]